jgi:hypothetical protein
MVRKVSPVRIRQRALEKAPHRRGFSLPEGGEVGDRGCKGKHEGNMALSSELA